jgi:hypothetical protein
LEKLEGIDHFGDMYKWNYNIKINIKEILREDADWNYLPYERVQWQSVVNTVMKLLVCW